jgi:hypothetical protein
MAGGGSYFRQASRPASTPRVLSAAPRGGAVPNNNISAIASPHDRGLAAIDAAVSGGSIE